jgi:hypothetical protein
MIRLPEIQAVETQGQKVLQPWFQAVVEKSCLFSQVDRTAATILAVLASLYFSLVPGEVVPQLIGNLALMLPGMVEESHRVWHVV